MASAAQLGTRPATPRQTPLVLSAFPVGVCARVRWSPCRQTGPRQLSWLLRKLAVGNAFGDGEGVDVSGEMSAVQAAQSSGDPRASERIMMRPPEQMSSAVKRVVNSEVPRCSPSSRHNCCTDSQGSSVLPPAGGCEGGGRRACLASGGKRGSYAAAPQTHPKAGSRSPYARGRTSDASPQPEMPEEGE